MITEEQKLEKRRKYCANPILECNRICVGIIIEPPAPGSELFSRCKHFMAETFTFMGLEHKSSWIKNIHDP